MPVRSSPVPAPLPGLSSFFPPPPVVSCIYEGRNVGQNVCGSYGPNKCSRPRTRDSQTGERRERERENRGRNFSDLFFTPGSRSQLSFLPDFPCLETFNPLTFYLGEEFDNFSSRYIFRGYIYLSLSLSFHVIEKFPGYTRRCFQIFPVDCEGKQRDIPGSHSEARAPISLTGLILRVYFPRSR